MEVSYEVEVRPLHLVQEYVPETARTEPELVRCGIAVSTLPSSRKNIPAETVGKLSRTH